MADAATTTLTASIVRDTSYLWIFGVVVVVIVFVSFIILFVLCYIHKRRIQSLQTNSLHTKSKPFPMSNSDLQIPEYKGDDPEDTMEDVIHSEIEKEVVIDSNRSRLEYNEDDAPNIQDINRVSFQTVIIQKSGNLSLSEDAKADDDEKDNEMDNEMDMYSRSGSNIPQINRFESTQL